MHARRLVLRGSKTEALLAGLRLFRIAVGIEEGWGALTLDWAAATGALCSLFTANVLNRFLLAIK